MSRRLPNILLITADQWRGDCLSALGHPAVRTPTLDGLAAEGVLFRHHYAQCAPCGPSRASLHTGMYLHNHRSCINGTPLDARFTNLALEARKLGYRPALFGYTDTSIDPRQVPSGDPRLNTYEGLLPGFDPVVELSEPFEPWFVWLRAQGFETPLHPREIFLPPPDFQAAAGRSGNYAPTRYPAELSETTFLTGEVLAWLERQAEPWFAHVSYYRPHPPFAAPPPYHDIHRAEDAPPPLRCRSIAEEAAQHPFLAWSLSRVVHRASGNEAAVRQLRATYYGLMRLVDDQLARLLQWLQASGEAERTVVVFTSDHGEMLGDHWQMGKLGYFDESFHVPLIIRTPDGPRGRIVEQFTESIDIMPTLIALAGGEVPRQCDGRSLVPFLRGETPVRWRSAAHWEYDFRDPEERAAEDHFGISQDQCNLGVIRDRRGKYVHFAALPPLFFDLERDPGQFVDRSRDPAYASTVLDYAQRLLSWRMNHDDRVLTGLKLTPGGVIEVREAHC